MSSRSRQIARPGSVSRRTLLALAAGCAGTALGGPQAARAETDAAVKLVETMTGKTPTTSDRITLTMPRVFPNGYTVPLALDVDSAMTLADHVRSIRVFAPKNPIVEVATFRFMPDRSRPRVSTRIRLAEPQFVVALADMNDGALLMTQAWVEVATNGCR